MLEDNLLHHHLFTFVHHEKSQILLQRLHNCLISYFTALFLISYKNSSYRDQNPNSKVPSFVSKHKEDIL